MKQIGTLGSVDTMLIGGATFVDIPGLKVLFGYGDVSRPYSVGVVGGSSYAAPGGKVFRILGMAWSVDDNTAPVLGYADTDIGINSATVPTNFVNVYGNNVLSGAAALSLAFVSGFFASNGPIYPYSLKFDVPSGKYPTISYVSGGGNFKFAIYGYEV